MIEKEILVEEFVSDLASLFELLGIWTVQDLEIQEKGVSHEK